MTSWLTHPSLQSYKWTVGPPRYLTATQGVSTSPLYICSVTKSSTFHLLNILSHCLSSCPYNYCSFSNNLFSCLDHLFPTFYYRNCQQYKKVERLEQWMCLLPSCVCVCVHVRARVFSCVRLFGTPWTVVCQAPLPMEFSRREYWSGLPLPPPESSWPRDQTHISCIFHIGRWILYHWAVTEAQVQPT